MLVQREVESGRSLLASIQPFRRASLDDTAPISRWWARRRSAEAATGFDKKPCWLIPGSSLLTQGVPKRDWLGKKSSRLDSASYSGKFRKRWATSEDLSFRISGSRRPGPKSDAATLPPSGCLIAARSCRARGAHVRAIADQRFHR